MKGLVKDVREVKEVREGYKGEWSENLKGSGVGLMSVSWTKKAKPSF